MLRAAEGRSGKRESGSSCQTHITLKRQDETRKFSSKTVGKKYPELPEIKKTFWLQRALLGIYFSPSFPKRVKSHRYIEALGVCERSVYSRRQLSLLRVCPDPQFVLALLNASWNIRTGQSLDSPLDGSDSLSQIYSLYGGPVAVSLVLPSCRPVWDCLHLSIGLTKKFHQVFFMFAKFK